MTQGTPTAPRPPQTGEARRASKDEYRRREAQRLADTRPLLSVEHAARHLDVSRWTVYRLIDAGELPTVTVSRRLKIRPADLDAYIARQS